MLEFNVKNAVVTVDPNNKYSHVEDKDIMAACGLLVDWLVDGALNYASSIGEHLRQSYVYSMGWHSLHEGSKVENDAYLFPGDPPQHALVKMVRNGETVWIFPHAIVLYQSAPDKEPVMERMD